MREAWKILVVEDDRDVAALHCRFVARTPGFAVVGVAQSAGEARQMIVNLRPDLLLLDLGLPGQSGVTLLRQIRASGHSVEVIAVTAAATPEIVRACLQLGVIDYLFKPFRPERLTQALEAFAQHASMFQERRLGQATVDGARARRARMPKDISEARLAATVALLTAADGPLTAVEVGAALDVGRSTAHRYLEHLVTVREVDVTPLPGDRGRPRNGYSLRRQ